MPYEKRLLVITVPAVAVCVPQRAINALIATNTSFGDKAKKYLDASLPESSMYIRPVDITTVPDPTDLS